MKDEDRFPYRRRTSRRLADYKYTLPGAYFITFCTQNKVCCLGNPVEDSIRLTASGEIVHSVWLGLAERFPSVGLDAFVVMPNHVHCVIHITDSDASAPAPSLGEVVRSFKGASTRLVRKAGDAGFAWQSDYHDRVVRNKAELDRIREYIDANPRRWSEDPENPDFQSTKEH